MLTLPESAQTGFVFALIIAATVLMASNRVRYDLIALLVVVALMLSGTLSVSASLAGFGNSVVILIAALLVVGEMLDQTGVARAVGDWIQKRGGGNELRLLTMIMVSSALLSAIMSSTAVVAIFIPIILRIAATTGHSASRLLLPMSYAALVSGMLTLIATPPNLVVSGELQAKGFAPLGFFSFSILGSVVLVFTLIYMLALGRRWLPDTVPQTTDKRRSLQALWQDYHVDQQIATLQIPTQSPLCGMSVSDSQLYHLYRTRVLEVVRPQRGTSEHFAAPSADFILHGGDVLVVAGNSDNVSQAMQAKTLKPKTLSKTEQQRMSWEWGAISVLVHPDSRLIGQSIRDYRFRTQYGLDIYGVRRNQTALAEFEDEKLQASDSLMVAGAWSRLKAMQAQNRDFVLLESPLEADEVVAGYRRMPIAVAILVAMITVSLFDWIPLVATVLLAAVAGVVTKCLSAQQAYRSISWSSLVLLAGMLPLADALQKTGGTDLVVSTLLQLMGEANPTTMMTLLFFITVVMTNILSNTAAAVLMAPIALTAAEALGVSPYPLAITIVMAASSAFLTPVASPVVTLVVEPGRYQFSDFMKLGSIMVLMVYGVTLTLVPLLFPW